MPRYRTPRPLSGRPFVNNVDRNMESSAQRDSFNTYISLKEYCPLDGLKLSYREDSDRYVCDKCGWIRPEERDGPGNGGIVAPGDMTAPRMKDSRHPAAGAAIEDEERIPIATKGNRSTETQNRRRDGFDYLRRDDAYLEKLGWVMKSDVIDFSDDRSTTISSEELRRQNI